MDVRKKFFQWRMLFITVYPLIGLQICSGFGWAEIVMQNKVQEGPVASHARATSTDVFAEIGGRVIEARRELLREVTPPKLPRKMLSTGKSDPHAAFEPTQKIDTPEKLDAELARQRSLYAPFLEVLAPELPSLGEALRLEDFRWRLETEADRVDFQHTLSGAGDWAAIKVPHFG